MLMLTGGTFCTLCTKQFALYPLPSVRTIEAGPLGFGVIGYNKNKIRQKHKMIMIIIMIMMIIMIMIIIIIKRVFMWRKK